MRLTQQPIASTHNQLSETHREWINKRLKQTCFVDSEMEEKAFQYCMYSPTCVHNETVFCFYV